jgi:hypothetical protein
MNAPGFDIASEMAGAYTLHKNLAQDVIVTTEDKVRICLMQHQERLLLSTSWQTPLGLTATLGTTLVAATFQTNVLSADTWSALFVFALVLSLVWLVVAVWRAAAARGGHSIDTLIGLIKRSSSTSAGFTASGTAVDT